MEKLTTTDYLDAIVVQDACNLSGVVFSWAYVMEKICNEGLDTAAKNRHAINVMYASKVASLTGCDVPDNFHQAYTECQAKAKKGK